ncbi:unnamed protein product [Nippostrongylus brasiliensis]|uniref:ABC transporter ATP-binding protein n=1 Tax=Nippostrongylus brasiliensis TaxID=27835 RepID=A0A0N4XPT7_NIPBR|nr:unnamed protein product [Nippostrongylus brasiliensis]
MGRCRVLLMGPSGVFEVLRSPRKQFLLQNIFQALWLSIFPDASVNLRAAVDSFRKRLRACIRAKGAHLEN